MQTVRFGTLKIGKKVKNAKIHYPCMSIKDNVKNE